MASTVLSVRVPKELKEQLEYLSRSTKRSKAYLATEALGHYVKRNAWRAKELHEAIAEADKGVFVSHEAMIEWADSPAPARSSRRQGLTSAGAPRRHEDRLAFLRPARSSFDFRLL